MKIFIISLIFISSLFANKNIPSKNCEVIELSKYTKLFACEKMDYLVEYKISYEKNEEDSIKSIILVTPESQKVIRQEIRNDN